MLLHDSKQQLIELKDKKAPKVCNILNIARFVNCPISILYIVCLVCLCLNFAFLYCQVGRLGRQIGRSGRQVGRSGRQIYFEIFV